MAIICNFCNKEFEDNTTVNLFVSEDEKTFVCENCVKKMSNMIGYKPINMNKSENNKNPDLKFKIRKPKEIRTFLDQYIIGQDNAKDVLSVAVYNHYKMLLSNNTNNMELEKSNILLLGPTGCGKTAILKALSKCLNVPFTICDTSTLTAAGYVGADVESCLKSLLYAADGNVKRAEMGIIYLDEFDKLSRKGENVSITRDVGGESVQQALLKMIEGSVVEVPEGPRKHPQEKCTVIDTSKILFICGGSFEGIEKIIQKRVRKHNKVIGFGSDPCNDETVTLNDVIDEVNTDDLKKFGMIPEIIGRLPIICTMHNLTEEAFIKILTEPKNSLCRQYKHLFKLDNVELNFTEEALKAIAQIAIQRETGARGLRSIMENILLQYMKIIPENHIRSITITADYINGITEDAEINYRTLEVC